MKQLRLFDLQIMAGQIQNRERRARESLQDAIGISIADGCVLSAEQKDAWTVKFMAIQFECEPLMLFDFFKEALVGDAAPR